MFLDSFSQAHCRQRLRIRTSVKRGPLLACFFSPFFFFFFFQHITFFWMRVFILFFENSFLCHFHHCCSPGRLTAVANASYFISSCVVGRPYSSSLLSAESYILRIEWRQQPARLSVQHFVLYGTITTGGFRRLIDLASPFFSSLLCCVFSIYFQALLILVSDFSFFIQTIFCAQLHLIPTCTSHPTLQTYSAGCITTEWNK